jgi:hypothetical protein
MVHNSRAPAKQTGAITRTMDILMPASAELCASCRAPMLPDQRYCLVCGDRRNDPRRYVAASAPPALPPARTRRPAPTAGATLIAGVATLLIALGVGVEIGRTSGKSEAPTAAAPVRVVTVPAAGGAAPAATAAATATPSATPDDTAADKTESGDKPKATPTPKPAKTPPPEVKVGSSGKGAGYKDGKFTGDFFGQ